MDDELNRIHNLYYLKVLKGKKDDLELITFVIYYYKYWEHILIDKKTTTLLFKRKKISSYGVMGLG